MELVEQVVAAMLPESEPDFAERRRQVTRVYLDLLRDRKMGIREVCVRVSDLSDPKNHELGLLY